MYGFKKQKKHIFFLLCKGFRQRVENHVLIIEIKLRKNGGKKDEE